jgi:hypothetical protein
MFGSQSYLPIDFSCRALRWLTLRRDQARSSSHFPALSF